MKHLKTRHSLDVLLDNEAFDAISNLDILRQYREGIARTQTVTTRWFDVDDPMLSEAGVTARLEKARTRWRQHISPGPCQSARVLRSPAKQGHPELAKAEGWRVDDELCQRVLDANWIMRVEAITRRTFRQLIDGKTRMDLELVHHQFLDEFDRQPRSGLRIELIQGSAETFWAWAQKLIGDQPAKLFFIRPQGGDVTLADRLEHDRAQPIATSKLHKDLRPGSYSDTRGLLLALVHRYGRAISNNAYASLTYEQPDGPYQLRVALRRLRATLKAFAPIMRRKQTKHLAHWARQLGRCAAPLRDADVLLELVSAQAAAGDERAQRIVGALEDWRADIWRQTSPRLIQLKPTDYAISLYRLSAGDFWTKKSARSTGSLDATPHQHLINRLDACWRKVQKRGVRLTTLSIDELHELRKDIKAIRYAAEIGRGLFEPTAVKAFSSKAKSMQRRLGRMNDLALVETITPVIRGATNQHQFECWRDDFIQQAQHDIEECVQHCVQLWSELEETPRFWTKANSTVRLAV